MLRRPDRSVAGLIASSAVCLSLLCLALAGTPLLATPDVPPAPALMTLLGGEQPDADVVDATEMHYAEAPDIPASVDEEAAVQDSETFTAVADATIIENYPTLNTANTADMWSGRDVCLSVPAGIVRSLVKFDIGGLPADRAITKAALRLYNVNSCGMAGQNLTITPYRVDSDWAEGSVDWTNQPDFGTGYGSQAVQHGEWGWYEFDVTELVQGWYDGTLANYGLMLRGPEDEAGWRGFFTSEGEEPPELVIEYEAATPLPTETVTPTVEPGSWLPIVFADGPAPTPTPTPQATPPPPLSLNPIENDDGDGTYTLGWSGSVDTTSYTLQEDDDASFSSPSEIYSGETTTYTVSDQAPGKYYYRVRAAGESSDTAWSNVESVSVNQPLYLCGIPDTYLSPEPCDQLTVNLLGVNAIEFPIDVEGDIDGTTYGVYLYLAKTNEIDTTAKASILLEQDGSNTILATVDFQVDNYFGGVTSTETMLYAMSITGTDPTSNAGDRLILRIDNLGPGGLVLSYQNSNPSRVLIPPYPN